MATLELRGARVDVRDIAGDDWSTTVLPQDINGAVVPPADFTFSAGVLRGGTLIQTMTATVVGDGIKLELTDAQTTAIGTEKHLRWFLRGTRISDTSTQQWIGGDFELSLPGEPGAPAGVGSNIVVTLGSVITAIIAPVVGSDGVDGVGVPAGGTAGQILSKIDATDYNTQWSAPVAGQGVPVGGTAGQILAKIDAADYNTQWAAPPADGVDGTDGVGVPPGGATGQVLQKIDGTDFNTQWALVGGGGSGGNGELIIAPNDAPAVVKARADYTLTGNDDAGDISTALVDGSVFIGDGTVTPSTPIQMGRSGQSLIGVSPGRASWSSSTPGTGQKHGTVIRPKSDFAGISPILVQRVSDGYIQGSMLVANLGVFGDDIPVRTVTDLDISAGTITATTSVAHGYSVGTEVNFKGTAGTPPLTYYTIDTVPSATTFTIAGTGLGDATNATGTVRQVVHGVDMKAFQSRIVNVTAWGMTGDGFYVHGNDASQDPWDTYDTQVTGLIAGHCDGAGFRAGRAAADLHGSSCIFLHNSGPGLDYRGGSSGQWTQIHCYSNYYAVHFYRGAGTRTKLSNSKFEHSDWGGIHIDNTGTATSWVQLTGNGFNCNNDANPEQYSHIQIAGGVAQATRWQIIGNKFGNSDNTALTKHIIDFGSYMVDTIVMGNDMGLGATGAGIPVGNSRLNFGTTARRRTICMGNIGVQDWRGTQQPTVAMEAGAGTSPPAATMHNDAVDTTGEVQFGTGTTPSAGLILRVTYDQPIDSEVGVPMVHLSPTNGATHNLGLVHDRTIGDNRTGFTVRATNAPAASQGGSTYRFTWQRALGAA